MSRDTSVTSTFISRVASLYMSLSLLYIYIYIYISALHLERILLAAASLHSGYPLSALAGRLCNRHRLNGSLAQRVPSPFLASRFRKCLDCEVLEGMFPWRTRYPFS